jgi:hypothetical protein
MGTVRSDVAALVLGLVLTWSSVMVLLLGAVVAGPLLVLGLVTIVVAVIW